MAPSLEKCESDLVDSIESKFRCKESNINQLFLGPVQYEGKTASGLSSSFEKAEDMVGNGAVDIHGRPSMKSKSGNWRACWLIFGCEVCERVAFYAIAANLVTYLTAELKEDVADSARHVNIWAGTTFLTPLIGAFLADSFLGRYWTLVTFSCGYFLAMIFVTLAVSVSALKPPECQTIDNATYCPPASKLQVGFFYFALYLMALGAGGIKSNVSAFAGDQFDEGDSKEGKRKMSFLNWWFVSISFGTMLSVSTLVYIQDNVSWSCGYGLATAVTGIAVSLFFCGTPLYRHQLPAGSPLTRIAQVIVAAVRKWKSEVPVLEELLYELDDKESLKSPRHWKLPHSQEFVFLDKAAVNVKEETVRKSQGLRPNPWLVCPVTQVEEVKLLIRMLPIWLTNLMFSTCFAQVATMFLSQGKTLDRHIGPHFQIPAASFPLFITLTICILLPLYDKYFVPFIRRFTGHQRGLTLLQRIGVGQIISTLAITLAALIELRRLKVARDHGLLDEPQKTLPMTIFWLLPQYMLTGACEVFISVGQLEFFYDQAPDSMRSVGAALYLSTVAVGNFFSGFLVATVVKATKKHGAWITNNLNRSRLHYFYALLAILSTMNFFAFLCCSCWYTYKSTQPIKVGRRSMQASPRTRYPSPLAAKALTYTELEPKERVSPDLSPLRIFS